MGEREITSVLEKQASFQVAHSHVSEFTNCSSSDKPRNPTKCTCKEGLSLIFCCYFIVVFMCLGRGWGRISSDISRHVGHRARIQKQAVLQGHWLESLLLWRPVTGF